VSELAERLLRLRRQAGLASPPRRSDVSRDRSPVEDVVSLPSMVGAENSEQGRDPVGARTEVATHVAPTGSSARVVPQIPESIRRLLGIRARASAPAPARPVDRALPGIELAPGLRYVELHLDWLPAPARIDASFARDFAEVERGHVLAFDTETTGLAGGAGTRAFMIGVADWVNRDCRPGGSQEGFAAHAAPTTTTCVAPPASRADATLRVRQLFLTQMRGEAPMLEAFASWLAPETVLLSYNGRCYDAPLLDARYRLARQRSPLPGLRHLDLLFPTRRRYKGRWENCRLATIERHVLGVVREDDLPGSEAPRAWLDYLRGGDARDLRRVLAHNDQDLRSLVRLLLRLGEIEPVALESP
jgi:uncharacterized protein YprB with RNaseH-like and TPR domain